MATPIEQFGAALTQHAADFAADLNESRINSLGRYYALILKWNAKLHLVAPCSPEEFAVRHVLESLLLLKHLPDDASFVDVGSGGGLPALPCLLVRDDLSATLIESSQRKSVFLREAIRLLEHSSRAEVVNARFEDVRAPDAQFVTCRAIERFSERLPHLIAWAPADAIFLLFGSELLAEELSRQTYSVTTELIAGSQRRFLIIARPTN